MSYSAEDRKRIYEEEKLRREREGASAGGEDESSLDLKPNVSALLAYIGAWITGIIFLVVEQKNSFVRFHAAQSIVTFGGLTVVNYVLGHVPFIGWFFNVLIGVLTFVLWIVLMVRAYNGHWYKLPAAGELAERFTGVEVPDDLSQPRRTGSGWVRTGTAPTSPSVGETGDRFRSSRAARIASSAFAIAWSFALLIFLNFFNEYIAYYHMQNLNGTDIIVRESVLTGAFDMWLPVVTTALVFAMIGHTILIIVDRYVLRQSTLIFLDVFSIAVVATLLSIFPFDFSVIPDARVANIALTATQVGLVIILLAVGVGTLVRFIRLTVNLARGTSEY